MLKNLRNNASGGRDHPPRPRALSPLGERVDRAGVFFSRGRPGEGVSLRLHGFDPLTPGPSPPKGRGENGPTQAAVLRWACITLCGLFLFGCRLDMHLQPKYKPLDPSNFFGDGRSARPEVPGTVAHGHLRTDELLYTGKLNGEPADAFPFPITRKVLERGRERYNIYCSPCHDYTGSGRGLVVQRGFPPPPSYHLERLVKAPAGHFFDVITHGYGAMYSYASRVTPEDRWAIVAYIRALQLSQHAALEDVPAQAREQLTGQAQ